MFLDVPIADAHGSVTCHSAQRAALPILRSANRALSTEKSPPIRSFRTQIELGKYILRRLDRRVRPLNCDSQNAWNDETRFLSFRGGIQAS